MKMKLLVLVIASAMSAGQLATAQTLEESVSQTLLSHPQIKEAYNLYQSRKYQIDEAKAGYYPKLDASAGVGPERIKDAGASDRTDMTRRDAGITLSQMLFDGFDTSSNVDRTDAEAKAQKLSLLATAENTALRVTEVYLNMLRQQEIFELSKDNLATHEQILSDITKRTTSGVGSSADLSQIQGRVARAYSNMAAAQNNLDDARAEYLRVVNNEPSDLVEPPAGSVVLPASLDEALKQATANNPVLLSALEDINAAQYQHEGAKANYYPKVSLEAGQNWYEDAGGDKGYSDNLSAMLRVRYNLFNGGADDARSRSTSALYSQSKDIHMNAYRQVEEGTRLAWQANESLKSQKEFQQQHVEYSYETVRAYKQQFTLGQRTLLDVLNTENELFEARKSLIGTQYDELYAQYRILNATGTLLDSLKVQKPAEWAAD
ncbi:MAG: TolC family outer membrane protein [Aeromonadaceae bacterium]|nr:TolC family outer membrane protein [Aeromonadaceae bacterium]